MAVVGRWVVLDPVEGLRRAGGVEDPPDLDVLDRAAGAERARAAAGEGARDAELVLDAGLQGDRIPVQVAFRVHRAHRGAPAAVAAQLQVGVRAGGAVLALPLRLAPRRDLVAEDGDVEGRRLRCNQTWSSAVVGAGVKNA